MQHPNITGFIITLAMLLPVTSLFAENNASHRDQVETLFRLTQMEKKIQESADSVVQLQLRQNPQLAPHRETIKQFFEKYIGWQALKEDIATMYMQTFSEKELQDINAFYITPAGQKVITEVPQLVQQRNQIAMQRLQENIGELQKVIAGSAVQQ